VLAGNDAARYLHNPKRSLWSRLRYETSPITDWSSDLFVFWHKTKKPNYLVVFLTGIVVLSIIKILITVLSIRFIEDAILFGFDLHWMPASVIRGASEGSVVALVGITAGDFNPNKETRKYAVPALLNTLDF